ncbi:TMEM43 family protein [Cellvibrio sp. pealriver]|uniref:TMEM43 family protein n=1 Tax=Cellvibrio sp. pealriver TaxID=1622269 RepID=UPI00066FF11B|nr:TMEM43 family protein [Cellvibrio sp. pealriver]
MGDRFTEITHTSWFSRIGASIKGLLFGILFIVIGVCLLFWNEGRAVKTHKALVESQGLVVSINAQEATPQMNGKLVHLTGEATSTQTLSDNLLPVSVQALKLQRKVETYQWEETSHSEEKKNMGGDTETITTYNYEKVWSDKYIDSSAFKKTNGHQNPEKWRYQSERWTADQINIGQYQLSETHKNSINNFQPLVIPRNIELPKGVAQNSDGFYYGKDEREPKIGDQQISFSYIPAQTYSVIGDLTGTTLTEHIASNGRSIALLQAGNHTADAMFEKAKSDNATLTWMIRLAGSLLLIIAFNMIFKPLSVLADVAPLFGNIVAIGTGIVSFLLGLILALTTISIAWIFYRPLVGLALLVAAAGLVYLLKRKSKQAEIATQLANTGDLSPTTGN